MMIMIIITYIFNLLIIVKKEIRTATLIIMILKEKGNISLYH